MPDSKKRWCAHISFEFFVEDCTPEEAAIRLLERLGQGTVPAYIHVREMTKHRNPKKGGDFQSFYVPGLRA